MLKQSRPFFGTLCASIGCPIWPPAPLTPLAQEAEGACGLNDASLTMTVLLPPVFCVIFMALALAVFWEASQADQGSRAEEGASGRLNKNQQTN
jgi:hypothetical protein